jgi:4-diphosphocytidyl-2-C-methyl-D-erythritol kinase
MVSFPNCKINLGLNILRKRADGYHDLETIFYPLALQDAVEVIVQQQPSEQRVIFSSTGLKVDGDPANNLCVKAYQVLQQDFPDLPAIQLHLHKNIPMGAGLGGGSADGAFVLQLLNKKCQLGLSNEQLINYALQLGSDCPFFILNTPCFATSRGEIMEPITLDLSAYNIVIVNPGIHVSTAKAFAALTPTLPAKSVKAIIQQPIATWKNELVNDFETPVFALFPAIAEIKQQLYQHGAVYASMSGSGSTVFGLFEKAQQPVLNFPADYLVQTIPFSA